MMPFGQSIAPHIFTWLILDLLTKAYFEDFLIITDSKEEYCQAVT